jgi:hypothetical protein
MRHSCSREKPATLQNKITFEKDIEPAKSMRIKSAAGELQVTQGNVSLKKLKKKEAGQTGLDWNLLDPAGQIKTNFPHGLTGTKELPTPVALAKGSDLPEARCPEAQELNSSTVYYAAGETIEKEGETTAQRPSTLMLLAGEEVETMRRIGIASANESEEKALRLRRLTFHTSTPATKRNCITFAPGDKRKKSMRIEPAVVDRTRAKMRWWQELMRWRQLKRQHIKFDQGKQRKSEDPRYPYALELDSPGHKKSTLFMSKDHITDLIKNIEHGGKKNSSYREFLFKSEVTEGGKKDSRRQFFLFEDFISCACFIARPLAFSCSLVLPTRLPSICAALLLPVHRTTHRYGVPIPEACARATQPRVWQKSDRAHSRKDRRSDAGQGQR